MHELENNFYFYYLMIHRKRDWGGERLGLIELYYDITNHLQEILTVDYLKVLQLLWKEKNLPG